jgi:hypothetical protein
MDRAWGAEDSEKQRQNFESTVAATSADASCTYNAPHQKLGMKTERM